MSELKNIVFGISSPQDIVKQSVVEIVSTDKSGDGGVYDERMGPLDFSNCKTCFLEATSCPGHFGHLNLINPIPNPLFISQLSLYFSIYCFYCSHRLLEKLPHTCRQKRNETMASIIHTKSKNIQCFNCKHKQPIFEYKNGLFFTSSIIDLTSIEFDECIVFKNKMINTKYLIKMLSKISLTTLKEIEIETKFAKPADLILTILPILPHLNRPFMIQSGQICDDDLTALYLEILKQQNKAKNSELYSETYFKHFFKIVDQIQILFNNSNGIAKHPSSGRKYQGLTDRICGKNGLLRNNCMGKRVDQTARAVAAPGPELNCDEIAIPRTIANILTRPIICTSENINLLQKLCNEGKVDRVERQAHDGAKLEYGVKKFCEKNSTKLESGDLLKKEDGTLIKIETGHEIIETGDVIIRNGHPIKTHPKYFRNFEIKIGDLVHRFLQEGDVVLINRQPTLHTGSMAGMYVKIHDDYVMRLPLSITFRLNLDFDGDEINIHSLQTQEAIHELIYKAHANINIISPTNNKPFMTLVQDSLLGLWLMSQSSQKIDKDLIDAYDYLHVKKIRRYLKLIQKRDTFALISTFFPKNFCKTTDKFQVLNGVWIHGKIDKALSLHLIETIFLEYGPIITSYFVSKIQKLTVKWLSRRGFTIHANDLAPVDYSKEIYQMILKNENGRNIRDYIHTDLLKNYNGNLKQCIDSGAKGSNVNIGQIKAIIGQQQTSSGYIDSNLSYGRVFAHDPCNSDEDYLIKHGFIVNSFASGMNVREFFCHAIPSREAVIQTATGTPASGYLYHKIAKLMENVSLLDNGQVILYSTISKNISLKY